MPSSSTVALESSNLFFLYPARARRASRLSLNVGSSFLAETSFRFSHGLSFGRPAELDYGGRRVVASCCCSVEMPCKHYPNGTPHVGKPKKAAL